MRVWGPVLGRVAWKDGDGISMANAERVGMEGKLLEKNKQKVAELFELLERWAAEEYWRVFTLVRYVRNGRSSALACLGAVGGREMERREGLALFAWRRR